MKQLAGSLLLLFFIFFWLPADELEFSNGDIITGTIISMDEDEVIIETEYGLLTIKRKFILKGIFSGIGADINTSENVIQTDAVIVDYSQGIPENGLITELLFNNVLSDTPSFVISNCEPGVGFTFCSLRLVDTKTIQPQG